jgi:hypothetical protein
METLLDVGDVAGPAWEPAAGAAKESAMPAPPNPDMRSPAVWEDGRANSQVFTKQTYPTANPLDQARLARRAMRETGGRS